jgi:hypothetical protein
LRYQTAHDEGDVQVTQKRTTRDAVFSIRGGKTTAKKTIGKKAIGQSKKGKKSMAQSVKSTLMEVTPATRVYLVATMFCTAVDITGLPAQALFGLDLGKFYQIWRPITSVSYFGPPSMSMANHIYFLVKYGQALEKEHGSGTYAWFLTIQLLLLTALGYLLRFPFQAQALIAAIVYSCAHMDPFQKMPFQFGMTITAWQLPFCMMGIDCLSQQSAAAAWPHLLGIFSGHVYHFFTNIWPALGGKWCFKTPKVYTQKLGGKPKSNVKGVDFRKSNADAGKTKGSKGKKLKKGIKLGASASA